MTEAAPDYHNDACYRCIQGECLTPPTHSLHTPASCLRRCTHPRSTTASCRRRAAVLQLLHTGVPHGMFESPPEERAKRLVALSCVPRGEQRYSCLSATAQAQASATAAGTARPLRFARRAPPNLGTNRDPCPCTASEVERCVFVVVGCRGERQPVAWKAADQPTPSCRCPRRAILETRRCVVSWQRVRLQGLASRRLGSDSV